VSVSTSPWSEIVGQDDALAQLQAAARNPTHAYLLLGPPGSGKRALARAFGAALLSAVADDPDRAVRLALDDKHPDLITFERVGASILAPAAEAIRAEAMRSPVEGSRKVLVLDDFHLVQPVVEGLLLKVLEEPPASTVFVVLAEALPPLLVPIASRCVRIDLGVLSSDVIVSVLTSEGADPSLAAEVAHAAGGDLDRARLLVRDPRFKLRQAAWYDAPKQLDDHGSTVSRLAAELRAMIDDAQSTIDPLHAEEIAELEARVERYGERGSGRAALIERQKREVRRLRTDEIRFGLATLASRYRDELHAAPGARARPFLAAITAIESANEALIRNPNESLLLQSLLLRLPTI
jgi:DNA polymerase-3 subunit delta'